MSQTPVSYLWDKKMKLCILLFILKQGCALRVPGCLIRRITLACGQPDKFIFSYNLYAGHPGSHSFEPLGSL